MATLLGKIVADFRTTLVTELAVGGTSATLQSATDADGNAIPSGTYYFTLDKEGSQKEHIVCSVSGTAVTSISSVSRQGVVTSGSARKHRIGASVEITDFAHISRMNDLLAGTTDLNASVPLKYDGTATLTPGSNQLATVAYADALTFAGAPNGSTTQKGIFEEATVAEQGTAAATGSTGARLVPANANLVKTSSGASDENKIAILDANGTFANGFLDKARTWSTVQSFTADNCQITTDADSDNDATRRSYVLAQIYASAFGDSSDGAFSQNSGTTTWNTAGKNVYQFSSFALTGTADLTIGSNLYAKPVYVFVNGDLTITSSTVPAVNFAAVGAAGGSGGSGGPQNGVTGEAGQAGTAASASQYRVVATAAGAGGGGSVGSRGGGGGGGGGGVGNSGAAGTAGSGSGGAAGSAGTGEVWDTDVLVSFLKARPGIGNGGGGGGGGSNNTSGSLGSGGNGGNGARGGGAIYFIVRGAINITSTFSAAGGTGSNGSNGGGATPGAGGGGGGGGGGGSIGIFYMGSVTANTATLTVTGGSGGTGGTGAVSGGNGGAGGNGQSVVRQISLTTAS